MVLISVCCPRCHSDQVVKCGKTDQSKQRYRCQNEECSTKTFILDYDYNGYLPEVKKKIIDMALNGSGIRDTARVLEISPTTVIRDGRNSEATRFFQRADVRDEICESLRDAREPVSYTHLDVYKRQVNGYLRIVCRI